MGGRKFDSGLLNVEVDGVFLGKIGRFVEENVRFAIGYKGLLVVLCGVRIWSWIG